MDDLSFLKKINLANDKLFRIIIIIILIITFLSILYWIYNTLNLAQQNCDTIKATFGDNKPKLQPINSKFNDYLSNYAIKTAYNACCGGNFKNDFIDSENTKPKLCALANCIKQGARCLDFEIYSYNNKPVIAASSKNSVHIKETFNYLPFNDAMSYIKDNAIGNNPKETPLISDPLFLNLRIMSDRVPNNPIYPLIAESLNINFGDNLLDPSYNLTKGCHTNICKLPLYSTFNKKVIVIIDQNTYHNLIQNYNFPQCPIAEILPPVGTCQDLGSCYGRTDDPSPTSSPSPPYSDSSNNVPDLLECSHLVTGLFNLHIYRENELATNSNNFPIQSQNAIMSMVLPNYSANSINKFPINVLLPLKIDGINFVGLSFQNFDANMELYSEYFADNAFVLKPDKLRYMETATLLPPYHPKGTDLNSKKLEYTTSFGEIFKNSDLRLPSLLEKEQQ